MAGRPERPMKNAELAKKMADMIRNCPFERHSFGPVEISSLQIRLREELQNHKWLFKLLTSVTEDCHVLKADMCEVDTVLDPTQDLKKIEEEKSLLSKRTKILQHNMTQQGRHDRGQVKQLINQNPLLSCEESMHRLLRTSENFAKGLDVDICSFIQRARDHLAKFGTKLYFGDLDERCHKIATLSLLNKSSVHKVANRERLLLICVLNQMDICLHNVELLLCGFLLTLQHSHASWKSELKHMADECDGHISLKSEETVKEKRRKVAELVKAKRLLASVTRRSQIASVDKWDQELNWWRCFLDTHQMHSNANSRAKQE